ncbi:hypothetical protein EW145_g2712 [Phellinidium pouzarii]|uniref:Cytochrome P450 n=1 Tax=Phellinidium pouzarii TaxID=167371 RepID=A0A4S4LAA8_9AGAM|nr:hypothetical protein EW145_g2712 [Phellinidium pouzarii]
MSLPVVITIGVATLYTYKFLRGLWGVGFTPGPRPLFSPLTPFGMVLPANWYLNPSSNWSWIWRKTAYFNYTHDVIAFVPWIVGDATYYTSSLDVTKQLLGAENKIHLEKPVELTTARFADVWRTVRSLYREVGEVEGWDQRDEIIFDEVNSFALKFTFTIISRCGFGFATPWSTGLKTHMEFPDALRLVSETFILRVILPQWAYKMPFDRLRRMDDAWTIVASSVLDAINKRKDENAEPTANGDPRPDLLSYLVASWTNLNKQGLEEHDVIANMFSLMFAGHETTSSALVTIMCYMAIYQDEQEKAYNEVCEAFSKCDPSENIDTNKLTLLLYSIWESQRLYASAGFIPRQLTEDAVINVVRPTQQSMHLKKGSRIMFDLTAIGRNPHIFKDPEIFKPSRWESFSEHDVAMFGFGPRSCVGRKFAQTEAVAFLSTLLYEWKIETNSLPGESKAHYEERVMGDATLIGTAFGLKRVPLRLTRRRI